MKKILPYILIVIVFANLFVPISVGLNKKNFPVVTTNVSSAETKPYIYYYWWGTGDDSNTCYKSSNHPTFGKIRSVPKINCEDIPEGENQKTVAMEPGEVEELDKKILDDEAPALPKCGVRHIGGCLVRIFYYAFFVPTSFMFAIAGVFFDHAFAYSVNSESYDTEFVLQGWGIVRDFCNMFFILVLLYVAFSTILNLNGSKTKEMIINIVIVGLLINFSLFATQVIIDASNILARIFYNTNTIQLTKTGGDSSGIMDRNKTDGVISLSAALVNKVNPQIIISDMERIGTIENDVKEVSVVKTEKREGSVGVGIWILVILLASVVNVVGFTVFLAVGLVFVGRIIGLWLAMIFAPLAFFSYTVPALGNIPKFGHKKWLPETLKLAFIAPIFIFFLYLIIAFLEKGLDFNIHKLSGLGLIIAILLPFAFIMILLKQAKKLAVDWSGDIGKATAGALNKVGNVAMVAGAAVATGGAALATKGLLSAGASATRGTIGRAGHAVSGSKKLINIEAKGGWLGKGAGKLRKLGKTTGKSSFDVRQTKIGSDFDKTLKKKTGGIVGIGRGKEGGYEEVREKRIRKRQKTAKNLEVGEGEKEMVNLRKTEADLQALKNTHKALFEKLDYEIDTANEALKDANREFGAGHQETKKKAASLKNARRKKLAAGNGVEYEGDITDSTILDRHGNVIGGTLDTSKAVNYGAAKYNAGEAYEKKDDGITDKLDSTGKKIIRKRSLNYLEFEEKRNNQKVVGSLSRGRKNQYAKSLTKKKWHNLWRGFSTSKKMDREAARRIGADMDIEE